jgi:hypothetical protein
MHREREIDGRGALRQLNHVASRREDEDLVLIQVQAEELEKFVRRLRVELELENLTFPFEARWAQQTAPFGRTSKITVLGLAGSDDDPWIDDSYGILCTVRREGERVEVPLADIEEVEFWTEALRSFSQPIPEYEPDQLRFPALKRDEDNRLDYTRIGMRT